MEVKNTIYYVPNDEFLYENIESLINADGYAVDRKEIQRLLFESIQKDKKSFVEVIIKE
jgi:predicted nucleic-acid-binding protein